MEKTGMCKRGKLYAPPYMAQCNIFLMLPKVKNSSLVCCFCAGCICVTNEERGLILAVNNGQLPGFIILQEVSYLCKGG